MRGIEGKNSDKAAALGSIVGSDFGIVRELNRLVEPLYDRLWADMGLTEVATIRPTD